MNKKFIPFAVGAALSLSSAVSLAQTWSMPTAQQRCPSKWGAADERGSANHMNAKSVLRAKELMRTGEVIEMAHPLNAQMPLLGVRRFDVNPKRTFMNDFSNRRGSNEEVVISEIGQVGTQFDGFAHQSHEDSHYNCHKTGDIATRGGFTKFGMDKVGTLITRGVMLDIAALKNVETLPDTYEVTVEDLEAAMQRQNVKIGAGDAVVINTGWGKLYGKDNARYNKSNPGIGVKAAEYLAKLDPMLMGADVATVEVSPNPDPKISLPVHQIALVVNGIHLLENMKLDEMAAKKVWEFAFIIQPIKAAFTGSTVAPVAIR